MSLALGEVELDLETNAVFGNLAKDSAQAFAAAFTGLNSAAGEPERTQSSQAGAWQARTALRQLTLWRTQPKSGDQGARQGRAGGQDLSSSYRSGQGHGQVGDPPGNSTQILKQSSAWWVYLQPGANGPIPVLFKAAEKYKEQAKTKFMEAPIRAVLLSTLFLTFSHCRQSLSTDANQQKSARDMHTATLPSYASRDCYLLALIRSHILQQGEAE